MISFRLFFALFAMLDHLDAGGRLHAALAGQLGHVAAEDGKRPAVRQEFRRLERAAFPREYPRLPADAEEGA